MVVIQSSFLSRQRSIAAFSILKCLFDTKRFSGFRFTTGRQDPSFFPTVKSLLTNCPRQAETFFTASLLRSFATSASTCFASKGWGGIKGGAVFW